MHIRLCTQSQRAEHSLVRREGGRAGFAENILNELAAAERRGIETGGDG